MKTATINSLQMSGGVAVAEAITEPCLKIELSDVARPIEDLPTMQSAAAQVDGGTKEPDVANRNGGAPTLRKRKKTRRGKSKRRRLKPYSRLWQDDKQRPTNNRSSKQFAYGQPEAPFNTTQFLMADHDLQGLDDHLRNVPVVQRPPRARDSSFSVDSEEDFFYSSPEDEGEFLSKEFTNTYEDLHAERISSMTKNQLIEECLMLEEKVDVLESRIKTLESNSATEQVNAANASIERVEDAAELEKLNVENELLRKENERLRRENEHLRCAYIKRNASTVSSVDSESDSSSSSGSSDSDSSGSDSEIEDSEVTITRYDNEEPSNTECENVENEQFGNSTVDGLVSPSRAVSTEPSEEFDTEDCRNSSLIATDENSGSGYLEPESATAVSGSPAQLEGSTVDSEESK